MDASVRRTILACVLLAECLPVFFLLARRSPVSGDDYAYLFQAELFASGKLYAESPLYSRDHPLNDCVMTKCLTDHQGRRFSKYPPGLSVLLAIGVALKAPWLVDPILGALVVYLFLAHVERRHGPELGRACGTLLVLNGFLVYYAASYRPHLATMLGVVAAFLLFEETESDSRRAGILLLASGALLGGTTLLRYLDFVPMGLWIACLPRSPAADRTPPAVRSGLRPARQRKPALQPPPLRRPVHDSHAPLQPGRDPRPPRCLLAGLRGHGSTARDTRRGLPTGAVAPGFLEAPPPVTGGTARPGALRNEHRPVLLLPRRGGRSWPPLPARVLPLSGPGRGRWAGPAREATIRAAHDGSGSPPSACRS